MKILEVKTLAIPEVKVVRYARFLDNRGYFTETFRTNDFKTHPELEVFHKVDFVQANESFSRQNVLRGLHFQWNPYQGKFIRTVRGHMIDMALDIRKGSPTWGKIVMYDMEANPANQYGDWIWLPPGFAHGVFFLEESTIEYYCTGEWSPSCEAAISPLAPDIDWSLCDTALKEKFDSSRDSFMVSEKDKLGFTLTSWEQDEKSNNFIYGRF